MKYRLIILISLIWCQAQAQVIPSYESYTLKNGLKVYLLQYGTIPAVNIKLALNTGKVNEIPGQQNFSALVSDAILKGNLKYNAEAQTDKLFAMGATLSSGSSNDYTSIEMNLLSKDIEPGFEVLSSAILTPTFPKEKMQTLVSQAIDYNSTAKMDITELAGVFSNYAIYGLSSPLGRYFYKAQLQKVTPEIIKEYYQFNFTPKNANLIICGSFDATKIKQVIETNFGSWKAALGNTNGVNLEKVVIKKKELGFIHKKGATQCALQWNKIAPAIDDKDFLAFAIANKLFNEMLFREIREKGGKTYSIGSYYKGSRFSNLYSVSCSVRSNELINTVELFNKTLQTFYLAELDETVFKEAIYKQMIDIKRIESPDGVSDLYNPLLYAFDKRKQLMNDLQSITLDNVKKVIKKYYTPDSYLLVMAGDETILNDQLATLKDYKKYSVNDIEKDN